MEFDRDIFNSYAFIRPAATANSQHARINTAFLESGPTIEQMAVYTLLRSKPPIHRWKTYDVYAMLKDHGTVIGMGKVEKAMAELNRGGWIRYVDIVHPSGKMRGAIVEVQYEQLPLEQRGKNRKIRVDESLQDFAVYEHDGQPVSKEEIAPNWGKKESPKVRKRKPPKPVPRESKERESKDRDRGEEYKEHHVKIHEVQKPLSPLLEKGESSFGFTGENDRNSDGSPVIPLMDGSEIEIPPPGVGDVTSGISIFHELRNLYSRVQERQVPRVVYERAVVSFLGSVKDPPAMDRWERSAAKEWCDRSPKGQFLLEMSEENEWPVDLARRFAKGSGKFSVAEIRRLMLSGVWLGVSSRSLKDFLPTRENSSKKSDNVWDILCSRAEEEMVHSRLSLKQDAESFNGEHTSYNFPDTYRKKLDRRRDFEPDIYDPRTCFDWLLSKKIADHDENFIRIREESKGSVSRLICSEKGLLRLALEYRDLAGAIWGIEWCAFRSQYLEYAEELRFRLDLYGLKIEVSPAVDLIDEDLKRS